MVLLIHSLPIGKDKNPALEWAVFYLGVTMLCAALVGSVTSGNTSMAVDTTAAPHQSDIL